MINPLRVTLRWCVRILRQQRRTLDEIANDDRCEGETRELLQAAAANIEEAATIIDSLLTFKQK